METIGEELDRVGRLPADRKMLVERNIELKAKLTAARDMLSAIMETQHKAFEHTGPVEGCGRGICAGICDVLRKVQP